MKKVLALIIALSVATIFCACGGKHSVEINPKGISLSEFKKLEIGMSLTEAESIFGGSIEEGTVIEISEKDNSTDDYYEKVYVYKVVGETTGYAELEFTYHKSHDNFNASINGLTAKTQYDLSDTQLSNVESNYYMSESNSLPNDSISSDTSISKYIEKIKNEFSTDNVTLLSGKYSDDLYFLKPKQDIDISVDLGCGQYKTIDFLMTYNNEDEEKICLDFFSNALKSDTFNFTDDEQNIIMSDYIKGNIDFKNDNFSILYTKSDQENIIVICIFFR